MAELFRWLDLDQISFWIGFGTATLLWWFLQRARPVLVEIWERILDGIAALRARLTASSLVRYKGEVYRYAQRQHLAAALGGLDDLLIEPRLLALPAIPEPDKETPDSDSITETLPYLPDFPELAAVYRPATLSLASAMQNGANLLLVGQPGAGKTTALAALTSQLARADASLGGLAGLLPVYIHAADLPLPLPSGTPVLNLLVDSLSRQVSPFVAARLPGLLREHLQIGNVLLLLDGADELPPADIRQLAGFLKNVLSHYPKIRLIVAAAWQYYGSLPGLGLHPVTLIAWGKAEQNAFLERWQTLWEQVVRANPTLSAGMPDIRMVYGWLKSRQEPCLPLDFLLRTWAACSGDALGSTRQSATLAYLRRQTLAVANGYPALSHLAKQNIMNMQTAPTQANAAAWMVAYARPETAPPQVQAALPTAEAQAAPVENTPDQAAPEPVTQAEVVKAKKTPEPQVSPSRRLLTDLLRTGLLVERGTDRVVFSQFSIAVQLAGLDLAANGEIDKLSEQPRWCGRALTLAAAALAADLTATADKLLKEYDEPTHANLIDLARWVQPGHTDRPWFALLMRNFASRLQDELLPFGIRARLLTALCLTGDPALPVLLRRLTTHAHPNVRTLAALGSGLSGDQKAVPDLKALLTDPSLTVQRAACMALGAIGGQQAFELIAGLLLHADEAMRRTAAETLAGLPGEGQETLLEGSNYDDLLVRRAAVYGLQKIGTDWAIERLEKIRTDDGQWVVRNAAEHALQALENVPPYIPQPFPSLINLPWLLAFAAERGQGIATPAAAREMLVAALQDGREPQKLAAMNLMRFLPDASEGMVAALYRYLYGPEEVLRDGAFYTVWHLGAAGAKLPAPMQFGFA